MTPTVLYWFLLLPGVCWVLVRVAGVERGPLVQLFAFTPYVAAWSWLPAALAVAAGQWPAGGVALAAALALAGLVLPRALPGGAGPSTGVTLRVMTGNLLYGGADPASVVALVRAHRIDVLAVQEFTAGSREALAGAGLDALLPHATLAAEDGPAGSGLYSRFPLADTGSRRNGGGFRQAYATVRPPGSQPLLVESAHPMAPWAVRVNGEWRADLAAQPKPDPAGPPRILLGDFNATLDHTPLRRLIASGYRDAAAAAGRGLAPTWPYLGHRGIPPVTLDHVLVDRRIGVRKVSVHRIPGSDHRVVVAELSLPGD